MRLIEQVLRETALSCDGIVSFGIGDPVYRDWDESKTPRIWVHLIQGRVNRSPKGVITGTDYSVVCDVSKLCDLDMSASQLEAIKEELEPTVLQYIKKINFDARVFMMDSISFEERIHGDDQCMAGFVLTFKIQLRPTVPC